MFYDNVINFEIYEINWSGGEAHNYVDGWLRNLLRKAVLEMNLEK